MAKAILPQGGVVRQPASYPPLAPVIPHPHAVYPDPIEGIMPAGTITLLSGASGVGKTAFVAEWCVRWRDGRSICWKPTNRPVELGVVAADRKWASHKQWFEAVGYPDIPHYSLRDDPSFNWDKVFNRKETANIFRAALSRLLLPPGSLIVVDPISIFIHGSLLDYKQTAVSLAHLDRVCTDLGVTVLGIMHMSKQKGDKKDRYTRPQDRILGSAALGGFTDTQMYLLGPEDLDEDFYGFGWIPHHAPAETFTFSRDPQNGLFIPYEAPDQTGNLKALYDAITESIAGTKTKELTNLASDQLGLARATTYRYLDLLRIQGKIERVGRGAWRRKVQV